MKVGFIGLGKMGLNMALNVLDDNWDIIGFDVSQDVREFAIEKGVQVEDSLEGLFSQLESRKIIFISTPSGEITNRLVDELSLHLKNEDIIIDSGNSNYHDSIENYKKLQQRGISFLDCGTSGGIEGARYGACLMIGGDKTTFNIMEPFFKSLACENGCIYAGETGSGHYLKMVHNGIEYGMMQAIGEGFDILQASHYNFDNEAVAEVWNHGSVIRSWLMELLASGFVSDPNLEKIRGKVNASGEAKWTIEEALKLSIPVPVISNSLFVRNASQIEDSFTNKVVSTLRQGFGGHEIFEKDEV
ncbi:MAG: decarboxylating 6-phosphogluconate dehydrogenase [Tetragenococcus koreensis]|nr:decarboxylating 6-phosphogluconate dehydrogenase [Staphylococcus equorum]MDN6730785.1 decarboxylating 6-phosphogluconate dehydrogenase [Atopostipes suicloacalis]MDN6733642.1 decarboxylating 6-phosphogluconate dehydrogenase [Tetragenococcus koreensis]